MSDEVAPASYGSGWTWPTTAGSFPGWARQRGRRTVQGEIEDALRRCRGPEETRADRGRGVPTPGCTRGGRWLMWTYRSRCGPSTGASCCAGWRGGCRRTYGCGGWPRRPPGFNARFSAVWRRYAYRVADHPGGVDPLLRGHVLWHNWPLDVDAMNAAAGGCWASTTSPRTARSARARRRSVRFSELEWVRRADGVLEATVQADAFCHNMVRSLVGAMLFVGDGHRPPGWPGEGAGRRGPGLRRPRRTSARPDPGRGRLPGGRELAARNLAARNKRTLPTRPRLLLTAALRAVASAVPRPSSGCLAASADWSLPRLSTRA